jgi:hypothetical protein
MPWTKTSDEDATSELVRTHVMYVALVFAFRSAVLCPCAHRSEAEGEFLVLECSNIKLLVMKISNEHGDLVNSKGGHAGPGPGGPLAGAQALVAVTGGKGDAALAVHVLSTTIPIVGQNIPTGRLVPLGTNITDKEMAQVDEQAGQEGGYRRCVPACLPACLPACVPACLPAHSFYCCNLT